MLYYWLHYSLRKFLINIKKKLKAKQNSRTGNPIDTSAFATESNSLTMRQCADNELSAHAFNGSKQNEISTFGTRHENNSRQCDMLIFFSCLVVFCFVVFVFLTIAKVCLRAKVTSPHYPWPVAQRGRRDRCYSWLPSRAAAGAAGPMLRQCQRLLP